MTIAVLGEAIVDLIMDEDGRYRPHLGGSPYNVAIALARQGTAVSYLSNLSDDRFGEQFYNALSAEGVTVAASRRSPWPTSIAMITVDEGGQPTYRLYREGIADKDTSLSEILSALPQEVSMFHSGSLAMTPSQLPKLKAVFEHLRTVGVPISIDLNIRARASIDLDKYLQGVRSLLPLANIVKASDEDLLAFGLHKEPMDTARLFHGEMQGGVFVFTRGAGGAAALADGATIEARARAVSQLKDTVGAGDTFHAAFLSCLLLRDAIPKDEAAWSATTLRESLEFAAAAAAINVSREGCSPPTRSEVLSLLESSAP